MNSHEVSLFDTHSKWQFKYDIKNISPLAIRIDSSQDMSPVHGCAASNSHGVGDMGWRWRWSKDPQGSLFGSNFLTLQMLVAPGTLYRASTHCVLMIKLSQTLKADSEIPDLTPKVFLILKRSLTGPKISLAIDISATYLVIQRALLKVRWFMPSKYKLSVLLLSVTTHQTHVTCYLSVLPSRSHCKPFLGQGQCLTPLVSIWPSTLKGSVLNKWVDSDSHSRFTYLPTHTMHWHHWCHNMHFPPWERFFFTKLH